MSVSLRRVLYAHVCHLICFVCVCVCVCKLCTLVNNQINHLSPAWMEQDTDDSLRKGPPKQENNHLMSPKVDALNSRW